MFVWKRLKINGKEARDGPFFLKKVGTKNTIGNDSQML